MDLKHKGISWVGNVFQKFEAVCQEVDSIINQDKVKYVETQVSSASANVKRLYSDVVQGLLPPIQDPKEAKTASQRGHVPMNARFRSLSHNEGKAANNVVSKSFVGHGTSTTDPIDNRSQAACKVPFVNEEVAPVPNHSSMELNVDLPLEKNSDVLLDKELHENMKENLFSELLSKKSDSTLTDKLTLMEPDATDPLSHSLSNVSTEINDSNKRASSVCDGSDMKLEDDALLLGNDDGVLIDKDASESSEEDTTIEFNASDPLKHMANHISCEVEVTNGEAILIMDNSHLRMGSSRLPWKNDDNFSIEKVATIEPNASDHLNKNHLSHVWSETNFISEEADDSNFFLNSVVPSGRIDHAMIDKDFNKSPVNGPIFEDDPNSYLLKLPGHANGISFINEEAIMVSDRNHLQLETKILAGKNDDALTVKYSNGSFEKDTIFELKHDASYSDSIGSFIKLESECISGMNSKALVDKASDASCKEPGNLELSFDHLNKTHLNHVWSETNFVSEEADDSNFFFNSVVPSGRIDHVMIDKDFNKSPVNGPIFEDDPNSYLLKLPGHANGISFINEDAIMVSDRNHLQLETKILAGKNDDALTVKYSNESLEKDTIFELEHDASYSDSNGSFLKLESEYISGMNSKALVDKASDASCKEPANLELSTELTLPCHEELSEVIFGKNSKALVNKTSEASCKERTNLELSTKLTLHCGEELSEVIFGKNSKALIDKTSDASCKEQTNLELLTELTLHCGEESVKETLCSYGNECEEDIVTSNGNPLKTSIHCVDGQSIHKVEQDSNILVNNLVDLSLRMGTTSKYLENGARYSSNVADATSSELASVVLTSGETMDETKPVSSLKPLAKGSFSAFRSSANSLSSSMVVHEKPIDQNAYTECGSHLSSEVVTSASYGNKAPGVKFVSSKSSLSSMESLGSPHDSIRYILDSEMETVDLGPKLTLEDGCDILDYKALHAVSRRTQKLRSYKKRIQDAFTTKKRLAKEYEQLAIWYGDTDLEFATDSPRKLDDKNASTSYMCDSEWELL